MAVWSHWRRHGPRLTVALTLAVGTLSLATGVANIGTQTLFGPLAGAVPATAQRTAGFTGALTGFLMLTSALGLRRGLRPAWYTTAALLPITALQGLVQLSPLSVPLVALSVLAWPVTIANRRAFDRRLHLSTSQVAATAAVVGAQAYGTVGTYALRAEFGNVSTVLDAFYYTLVTASTVGYGDAAPQSQAARLFALSVIVVGTASFALAVGTLLGPAIEARLTTALGRMTDAQLELTTDHVLVLGYGDLTEAVLEALGEDVPYVVVTEADTTELLDEQAGHILRGDPSDEATLQRAGIDRARAVLVATNDDAADALAVLTASQLNPEARIVAAATNRENVRKLERAGADEVISPASIGGQLLVRSALGEVDLGALADRVLGGNGERE